MTPEIDQKSVLILSAGPALGRQAARSATEPTTDALRGSTGVREPVSVIHAELRRISLARRHGARSVARRRLDRLIDYIWFDAS